MSAPASDLFSSSVSSSGHVDGLGRRSLSFDRETGAMLERLHVRPELTVFEQIVRKRIEQLSQLEQPHFARPVRSERDASTGELVVLAEFVSGNRLSDLLDAAADTAVVPGVDVALGFLLQVLPALTVLHSQKRSVHGLIDPTRTILTSDGRAVFVDLALGPAIELLHLSPPRLWNDFGVCTSSPGAPLVLDAVTDVTQTALVALMLVLGRNLHDGEYPDSLPALVSEVIEVAHIRGTPSFGSGLQRILQRSLPLAGRRPYASAEEALADVNQLVRQEIGVDVCKRAIVDFVTQMDAAISASFDAEAAEPIETGAEATSATEGALDQFLDQVDDPEPVEASPVDATSLPDLPLDESEDEGEMEISLEQLEPSAAAQPQPEEIYDLPTLEDLAIADPATLSSELAALDTISVAPQQLRRTEQAAPVDPIAALADLEPVAPAPAPPPSLSIVPPPPAAAATAVVDEFEAALAQFTAVEPAPAASPAFAAQPQAPAPGVEPEVASESATIPAPEAVAHAPVSPADTASEPAATAASEAASDAREGGSSRRRKRQQQKSARARKDKLRSTTSDQKPAPPPAPPAAPARPAASPSGWLVSPSRSTEPPIPDPPPPPPPPPRPIMPSFAPTPVGQLPQPAYANLTPQVSPYGSPTRHQPPAPPVQAGWPAPAKVKQESSSTVGVKPEVQMKPLVAVKKEEPALPYSAVDRFSTLSLGQRTEEDRPREFPWRLAAVAVAVAVVAIIVGRSYLPGRTAVAGEPGADDVTPPAASAPVAQATAPNADTPIPAGKGRINIQTQPAGIKVLLDRKPIGETPLIVDAAPGRRVLTFLTSGGEVMHSVRVVAGKTVPMDVPVFSGWVSIAAPVILDIAEGGRNLGTTEQTRLMLPPGRHRLTLSNKELGYSGEHEVDVEPGGVRSLSVTPKGSANLNASPWAEVWLDGTKLGDTPLANTQVPLGLREFVFKHPQYGERRVPATIRGNSTATVAVDFTK